MPDCQFMLYDNYNSSLLSNGIDELIILCWINISPLDRNDVMACIYDVLEMSCFNFPCSIFQ